MQIRGQKRAGDGGEEMDSAKRLVAKCIRQRIWDLGQSSLNINMLIPIDQVTERLKIDQVFSRGLPFLKKHCDSMIQFDVYNFKIHLSMCYTSSTYNIIPNIST